MKSAFLLDEQISPKSAEIARRLGLDVRAVCGSELGGKNDESIFRAAVHEGRIMVTYNIPDFSVIYSDLLKEGVRVPGLIFVNEDAIPRSDVAGTARALVRLASRIEKGEVDASGGVFLT